MRECVPKVQPDLEVVRVIRERNGVAHWDGANDAGRGFKNGRLHERCPRSEFSVGRLEVADGIEPVPIGVRKECCEVVFDILRAKCRSAFVDGSVADTGSMKCNCCFSGSRVKSQMFARIPRTDDVSFLLDREVFILVGIAISGGIRCGPYSDKT